MEVAMAKVKYYAIRRGLKTGIVTSWEECKAATQGYSKAEYKSFGTYEEAEAYLKQGAGGGYQSTYSSNEEVKVAEGEVIAYVDGSYDNTLKKYAFGCVIFTPKGDIIREAGNGDNPESLALRNVTGEMLGAMYVVKWAISNGYKSIEIRYDYAGIEKWVSGEWRAKTVLTKKYADTMNEWKKQINIKFCKVVAHSNDKYNDEADMLAKKALTEGTGIPKIKKE